MKLSLFLILITIQISFSQDILTKRNGEKIEAKIELISSNEIKYKMFKNPDGPSYLIEKSELTQLKLENGDVQTFDDLIVTENTKISKEETMEFIVKSINEHGFEEDGFTRKYRASFEGDFLRLIILRKNGEAGDEGILYDFSNVYKFQKVSKRADKLAFINIYVAISKNKKNTKWDKHKLIMRVDSSQVAESILNALKHYNSFFVEKNDDSKF